MKRRITIRIDEDVLEWFKSQGKGYQSAMNDVLRDYYNGKLEVKNAVSKIRKAWKKDEVIPKNFIPTVMVQDRYTDGSYARSVSEVPDPFFRPNLKQGKKAKK